MDAGVATVQNAIVPGQSMRVRVGLGKMRGLENSASRGVVFDEPRPRLVSGHQPNGAIIPGDAMRPRHTVRDQKFGLPCLGIHPKNSSQPERSDPELPVDILGAVATAAVVSRAKRNLTVAD